MYKQSDNNCQQTCVICLIDFVNTNISDARQSFKTTATVYGLQIYQNFKQACTVVTIEYDRHTDFIIFQILYMNLIKKQSSCIQ